MLASWLETPGADFADVETADVADAFKNFERECELAREAVASFPTRRGGHAGLLREQVDGATGV